MRYDAIVIGAGIGGLSCAARLVSEGKKVLVLETDRHVGGTSYIFWRGRYGFPMGPLSFAFPERVRRFLEAIEPGNPIAFRRSRFAVAGAGADIVISRPLHELGPELERSFPAEREGLGRFFAELEEAVLLSRDVDRWHPDFRFSRGERRDPKAEKEQSARVARARELAITPCADRLRRHLRDERLVRLLGSQGTTEPEMSMLKLGFMWSAMSEVGIWSPSCGIHGLSDRLAAAVLRGGGEIGLSRPATGIVVERKRAVGVVTADGVRHEADWVISNADAKTTFLKLLDASRLPEGFRRGIDAAPYTGSELRVYLGIDPRRVDLSRLPAAHVLFQVEVSLHDGVRSDADEFAGREIEACLWSEDAPDLVPPGRAALILGTGFVYEEFSRFRTGPKKRTADYRLHKRRLVRGLVGAAARRLPGLESAIEVLEAATPLTFEDWGHRPRGSIAGWSWSVEHERALGRKILVETPVDNLLQVGIYAAAELFLGGIPTSIHTAGLAADRVLGKA